MDQDKKTTTYGDEEGFHITVRPSFSDEGFELALWRRNHGTAGFTIFDRTKAERIAALLYEELLPEYNEQERRQKVDIQKMMEEMEKRPKPKPLKILKNAPIVKVLECPECNKLIPHDEVSEERVYECSACGTTGTGDDGRRCESCHKFAAKLSDTSCPECGAAMDDADEVEAQRATNGTLVLVEQRSP